MIGADVEDHGVIRGIVQQGFIAFVSLQNTQFPASRGIIAGKAVADEMLGESAGDQSRRCSDAVESLRQPGGNGGFAAAAGYCEYRGGTFLHEQAHRFGAVQTRRSRRSVDEIRIVIFDCGRINEGFRRRCAVEPGTVLRIKRDAFHPERINDPAVFRRVQRPVASGCAAAEA